MLAELRDYIKTLNVADHYTIGKIDSSKDKSLGIYGSTPGARIEAIGQNSSYDTAAIRILLHWSKNAKQAEEAARTLYAKLRNITNIDMGEIHVQYIDLQQSEPVFVGTDDTGIYEYVIPLTVYYRRTA